MIFLGNLENDCIAILEYSCKRWPEWVSIVELIEYFNLPPSTIRTIFMVAKDGIFVKYNERGCFVKQDAFDKIAKKFGYSYKLIKKKNNNGSKCWHISAVKTKPEEY